jgi:hypothetical protein
MDAAATAYERVLETAGASLVRDAVDRRIVEDVRNETGRLIDSPWDVGGWLELAPAPAPPDTDRDGIPDAWENAHGLDPFDARDGAAATRSGYTNLEQYLNGLTGDTGPARAIRRRPRPVR